MTIRAELPPLKADRPPHLPRWTRRRIAVTALITTMLLALVGAGIAWIVYANTYQPLARGSFGIRGGPNLVTVTDGVETTRMVVAGKRGTVARTELSLSNRGSHDVTVLGLGETSGRMTAEWGPDFNGPDNRIGGSPSQARPFPKVLAAGREIALWLYVTKPACPAFGMEEATALPIRWEALGVHHVYALPLDGNPFLPIDFCVPRPNDLNVSKF